MKKMSKMERIFCGLACVVIVVLAIGILLICFQNKQEEEEYAKRRTELIEAYQKGTGDERLTAALSLSFGSSYEVLKAEYTDNEATVVLHAVEESTDEVAIRDYARDTVTLMSWVFGMGTTIILSLFLRDVSCVKGGPLARAGGPRLFMREERLCPHNCPQSPEICPEILLNSARRIYEKTRQKTL